MRCLMAQMSGRQLRRWFIRQDRGSRLCLARRTIRLTMLLCKPKTVDIHPVAAVLCGDGCSG